jgi:FkbM family methyltransferase
MNFRKLAKKCLYTYWPGLSGALPYFGTRVYFPRKSHIFDLVCEEGIYEHKLLALVKGAASRGGWYFDVGANIGLMSVPILKMCDDVNVLSFEPSPNSREFLSRTWQESPWKDRWQLRFQAVGSEVGESIFYLSDPRFGGYDGLKDTGRVAGASTTQVPLTTLDEEWRTLGSPHVACVKLDIEGAEIGALKGATELIQASRPWVFLEWYESNFKCFGHQAHDLFNVARAMRYQLVALPNLVEVRSPGLLALHVQSTASFALIPC